MKPADEKRFIASCKTIGVRAAALEHGVPLSTARRRARANGLSTSYHWRWEGPDGRSFARHYNAGETYEQLAQRFGISLSAARTARAVLGLPERTVSGRRYPRIVKREQKVLDALKERGPLLRRQIVAATGFPHDELRHVLASLQKRGIVLRTGRHPRSLYRAIKKKLSR